MALAFLPASLRAALLRLRRLLLHYVVAWSALLIATIAVASFAPEMAFVWAVTPTSSFSRACSAGSAPTVRVPTEGPAREVVCFPAGFFRLSTMDLLVPPLFAVLVVGGSTCVIRAVGLWEYEDDAIDS